VQQSLGIIGLGLVGTALSARLRQAGVGVAGYDLAEEQMRKHAEAGGETCASAAAVAAQCELVLLSLPTLEISASVVEEILPHLRPGATVVDTTTGSPEETAALAARLAARGVDYLESLIGGSSSQVRAGEAIAICGGEESVFERCAELFHLCFREVFYLGACGNGSRMKLVLNLVLGLNRAVLAEGLEFAAACGIEPAGALEILRSSSAYSRVMDNKGRRMVERDFEPEARLSQHLKDVRIILALGERSGARLPLSLLHRELLEEAEAAGYGGADNSAIICSFRNGSAR
jgi:3-hydroxyisobutyrate dehydrogenase-like beta-hydroxyacid dehydrogenase